MHRRSSFSSSRTSSPCVPMQSHNDPGGFVREREHNWNSPHPIWPDHTTAHSSSSNSRTPLQPRASSPTISLNLTETGYKPSIRSLSPFPVEQTSPTPSRASSLDNIHRHHDASLRHFTRPPSLSFSKKNPRSANKSVALVKPNIPPTTSPTPKHPPPSPFDQSFQAITPPTRSPQAQTSIPRTKHVRKSIASLSTVEGQNTSGPIIQEIDTDGTHDLPFI